MQRFDQRQGFLISALVHSVIVMTLASRPYFSGAKAEPDKATSTPEVSRRVFMPSADVLRQLTPKPLAPRPAAPRPAPTPPPPTQTAKDRISIGAPTPFRQKDLILRKDDDLTKVAKGLPNAVPKPQPTPPPEELSQSARVAGSEIAGAPGLRRPLGATEAPRGDEGQRGRPGVAQPSIAESLRNFDRNLQEHAPQGPVGLASGTGQQMGAFFFDPQGADFTVWMNHFKNEVYRNWIVPQPALMGFRGHVDLEFTVLRDGTMTGVRLLKSSGTNALDRAAQNALLGSQPMRLPSDYAPDSVTIQVTFYYNEGSDRS